MCTVDLCCEKCVAMAIRATIRLVIKLPEAICQSHGDGSDGSDGRHACSKYQGHTHYYQIVLLA